MFFFGGGDAGALHPSFGWYVRPPGNTLLPTCVAVPYLIALGQTVSAYVEGPINLRTLGPRTLAMGRRLAPQKYVLCHVCYLAKCGRSLSNGTSVIINIRRKKFDAVCRKLSKLVRACRNYSLPNLARFFLRQCIYLFCERHILQLFVCERRLISPELWLEIQT